MEIAQRFPMGLVAALAVLVLVAAACSSEEGGVATETGEADTPSEEQPADDTPDTVDDVAEEDDADQSSGATTDSTARDDYVEALSAALGASDDVFDPYCVAAGAVDAVGVEAFVEQRIDPIDLAAADNLADAGLVVNPNVRSEIEAVVEGCIDMDDVVEFVVSLFDFDGEVFDDQVQQCLAGVFDDYLLPALVDALVDGSEPDLGPELQTAAGRCGAEAVGGVEGAEVTWGDGDVAFLAGLITVTTTPGVEGGPSLTEDEATCFAGAVVDVLGPALDAAPDLTVGALTGYLGGVDNQESLGIVVEEPEATALAEQRAACVDDNRITAQVGLWILDASGAELVPDAASTLEQCYDLLLPDETLIEVNRVFYLYGSDWPQVPEAVETVNEVGLVAQLCAEEILVG